MRIREVTGLFNLRDAYDRLVNRFLAQSSIRRAVGRYWMDIWRYTGLVRVWGTVAF
ncbi:MAG: hypothetical protein M2R45_00330 [Verrucomicrobia subdivision 3 bacterium]|nr:hypothetical protein [Limisphaerales bacterium]MCS1412911.1 hypothetical protein [Limisphaerales bacterium]